MSSTSCVTAGTDTTNRTTRASPSAILRRHRAAQNVAELYGAKLVAEGTATEDEIRTWRDRARLIFANNTNSRVCRGGSGTGPSPRGDARGIRIGRRTRGCRGGAERVPRPRRTSSSSRTVQRGSREARQSTESHHHAAQSANRRHRVDLPLLRALGAAVTKLPDEGEDEARARIRTAWHPPRHPLGSRDRFAFAVPAGFPAAPARAQTAPGAPHDGVRGRRRGRGLGDGGMLAFGSLLLQTDDEQPHCHVSPGRTSSGTFNHRHSRAVLRATSRAVNPLDNLGLGRQDRFVVANSPLSEHAILGFEYGYSVDSGPSTLVLWERVLVISETTRSRRRPVRRHGRGQVGATLGLGTPPPARVRRPGTGPLERATGTMARRGERRPDSLPVDPRKIANSPRGRSTRSASRGRRRDIPRAFANA